MALYSFLGGTLANCLIYRSCLRSMTGQPSHPNITRDLTAALRRCLVAVQISKVWILSSQIGHFGAVNIKPWRSVIKEGNKKRIKWKDRAPFAYWKLGNPYVSPNRKDLFKSCNGATITLTIKAQDIGRTGSHFIHKEYVYDYMFHLLNEYAKLLKFEPIIPANAVEICSESSLACNSDGTWRKFMEEGLEKSPSYTNPCTLPPPYEPQELKSFVEQKNKWRHGRMNTGVG